MGGKIECYLDISSFYSYVIFKQLQDLRHLLQSHAVELIYHPVFLGAINNGSGNKPPWTLPAKAKYGPFDVQRSLERAGLPEVRPPPNIMAVGMTVLPLRALHFIKGSYPRETFETTFHYLFHCFWTPPNANLTVAENLIKALAEVPAGFKGPASPGDPAVPLFSPEDVGCIMQAATSNDMKDQLRNTVQSALSRGAFGAPWLWVTNSAGKAEPFFGSDRLHFVYKFLGLPYQDVTLLPPSEDSKSKL